MDNITNSTTVQSNGKKCHGNKKLQRFRRRRRERGMSDAAIEKAIVARTSEKEKFKTNKQMTSTITTTTKRKRDVSIQGLQERIHPKSNKKQRRTQTIQALAAQNITSNDDYPSVRTKSCRQSQSNFLFL